MNRETDVVLRILYFCDMIQVYPPAENKNKLRLLKFIENNHCCDSPVKRCNIFFWRGVNSELDFLTFPTMYIFVWQKN